MSKIVGKMAGCYSPMGKTFILTDDDGNEFTGVVTDQEKVFDARPTDVRINRKFVSNEGAQTGENTITYRTQTASCLILPGQEFSIPLKNYNQYDYTKFQSMIVLFNSDYSSNANAYGITIEDRVFSVESSALLSNITKNSDTKAIDFNIVNNTENTYEIFYFTYREETGE